MKESCGETHPTQDGIICDGIPHDYGYHASSKDNVIWDGLPPPVLTKSRSNKKKEVRDATPPEERTGAPTGTMLKERGMARAIYGSREEWREAFRAQVGVLARSGQPFTSEDVVDVVGLPSGDAGMNANNAVGAMMNAMGRAGVIRKTSHENSKRESRHGSDIGVWVGA